MSITLANNNHGVPLEVNSHLNFRDNDGFYFEIGYAGTILTRDNSLRLLKYIAEELYKHDNLENVSS